MLTEANISGLVPLLILTVVTVVAERGLLNILEEASLVLRCTLGSQKECVLSSCLDPTELDDAVHVCSNGRVGGWDTCCFLEFQRVGVSYLCQYQPT